MLSFLPPFLRGCLAALLLGLNILLLSLPLMLVSVSRFLIPVKPWRRFSIRVCTRIAEFWITLNSGWMKLTRPMQWQVSGLEGLKKDNWYLVICNHQSWADIFIVQHLLNHRIPMLKFFIKQELIWIPVIGQCWWALDFPFMKRHSKAYLERHPEKRGEDFQATRRACEKFQEIPTSIFNFVEGTRYTRIKHKLQQSPFQYLLKPRAGGTGLVLGVMGDQLKTVINITISYHGRAPSFREFLCGLGDTVSVVIEQLPIPDHYLGKDYRNDATFREQIQSWINDLWMDKDHLLESMNRESPQGTTTCTGADK